MPVLTIDELSELNPDKTYLLPFVLHYHQWKKLDSKHMAILNKPIKIQFDSNIRNKMGGLKTKKGIYMFIVEPEFPFIPSVNYLVYVGRVMGKNTFFSRFYEYVTAIGNKKVRRNIQLLTNLWEAKTWVYFYELALSDIQIAQIEQNIFDNIIPPLNNQFRVKRALNSRSIYN